MKKIKVGTKLIACYNLMLGNKFHLTNLKEYEVKRVDESNCTFTVIDDQSEEHIFNFSDVPNVWFNFKKQNEMNIPEHYNNDNGTLYKVATERGWNSYIFDIVKRLERSEKKGEFRTDLEKSKVVIDLWIKESER